MTTLTSDTYYKYVYSLDSDVKKVNTFGEKNGVLHAPHNMEDTEEFPPQSIRQSNRRE